jgi:hypothetical protein
MEGLMREPAGLDPGALSSLPIFPLPNCVLLPGGLLPLHVFETRYRDMTRDCLAGHHLIAVARLRPGFEATYYGRPPVYDRCGVGRIICSEELPADERAYRRVEARVLDDASCDPALALDHQHRLIALCDRLAEVIEQGGPQLRDLVRSVESPGECADAVAAALIMDPDARQALLEACDPMVRLQSTVGHVSRLLCELAPCTNTVN